MVFYCIQSVISWKFTCALWSCKRKTTIVVSLLNWPLVKVYAQIFPLQRLPDPSTQRSESESMIAWRVGSRVPGHSICHTKDILNFHNDGTTRYFGLNASHCVTLTNFGERFYISVMSVWNFGWSWKCSLWMPDVKSNCTSNKLEDQKL